MKKNRHKEIFNLIINNKKKEFQNEIEKCSQKELLEKVSLIYF
jgi:hypothetical protein